MSVQVNMIGKFIHPEPIEIPFHSHRCYELVLYTQGEGVVEAGQDRFLYRKNSIVIVPPRVSHNEVNRQGSQNLAVGFQTDEADMPSGLFSATSSMVAILQNMMYEQAKGQQYAEKIINLQMERLKLLLLRAKNQEEPRKDFARVMINIDNYIDENLGLPIRLKDFAEMYGYSPDRFRHLFTENTGVSPKQYILAKRLKWASAALAESALPITAIACECGFYDASQFSRLFKRNYGVTPTAYRRGARNPALRNSRGAAPFVSGEG